MLQSRASYHILDNAIVAQVVEVPGDHFSLLRQDEADMAVLVSALKSALAPYGWTEQTQPHKRPYTMNKVTKTSCEKSN